VRDWDAPRQAPSFYGVIGVSIVVGLALNFIGIDPIRAPYVSAILSGLAAPPLILLMLILSDSSSTRLEGRWLSDGFMGVALLVMTASGAAVPDRFDRRLSDASGRTPQAQRSMFVRVGATAPAVGAPVVAGSPRRVPVSNPYTA
jgi:hypothetical protein